MPISHRPEQRAKQVANLREGGPPAPEGNQYARSHGGYGKIAESKSGEIYRAIAADVPLRAQDGGLQPADAATVRLLADVLTRLDSIGSYLQENGLFGPRGVRPAVELESKLRREAADHCDALGLSPRSRARLGLDLVRAAGAAEEAETNRAARERLDARLDALDSDAVEVEEVAAGE